MQAMQSSRYDLSPSQAAEILDVHEETVKRWARDGKLRSFTTPGGWRKFSRADLDAFIAARIHEPNAEDVA